MDKKIVKDTEKLIKQKYGRGGIYQAATTSILPVNKPSTWSEKLLTLKFGLLKKYIGSNTRVIDVACGNGIHTLWASERARLAVGVDLSPNLINYANKQTSGVKRSNVEFKVANAKKLPFKSGTFDVAFSFSALYYIPEVDQAISEIARIIKTDGVAILEMGNSYSLNNISGQHYPELAKQFLVSVPEMKRYFENAKLTVIEHKSFQLLPLWSDRPWYLYPLLHPAWKKIMAWEIRGKMIDEIVSSLPWVNRLAFRHMWILRKV